MKKAPLRLKHNAMFLFFLSGLAIACFGYAQTEQSPEERGLELAQKAYAKERGFSDSGAELTMILRTASGQEAKRELRIRTLEISENESRALIVFDVPQDVKGTALLTHSFTDKSDDQWLFLPAVGRTKRIAGGSRSGPFMGSEFSFEDMTSQRVEKFTYKYLHDEELNGRQCHALERYPSEKESGYTKQVAWLDVEELRIQKVDYYDRRGELLKTLVASDYEQHESKYWRPKKMEMTNHQNGKSTVLEWKNTTFNNGYTAREFDQNALRSTR